MFQKIWFKRTPDLERKTRDTKTQFIWSQLDWSILLLDPSVTRARAKPVKWPEAACAFQGSAAETNLHTSGTGTG